MQVIKDPIGTKGARLSTQISIAGRMLVYLPQDSHIGISQKIEKESDRDRLRSRLQSLLPPEEKGGYIVRTMAEEASDTDLAADVDYLRKTWGAICLGARTRPATSLLYQDLNLAQRVLRDFVHDETATIQVDSRENYVEAGRIRQGLHAERSCRACSTTPASGRCSTCTASRKKSCARWAGASTSNRAAT